MGADIEGSSHVRILIASSEVYPYSKTGGLADVAGALPVALAKLGHDVRVVTPLHGCVDVARHRLLPVMKELDVFLGGQRFRGEVLRATMGDGQVPIYFIQSDELFDRPELYTEKGEDYPDNPLRFAFWSLAAIWMMKGLDWAPDIVQANDWQASLIPAYLKKWPILNSDPFYSQVKVLLTIHNLAYQGLADPSTLPEIGIDWSLYTPDGFEFYDQVNFLKGGILWSDHISTVSPTYAQEIQHEEQGAGLDGVLAHRSNAITGILNGIDTDVWNPAVDTMIEAKFNAENLSGKTACKAALQKRCGLPVKDDVPVVGMITRLAGQKGFDLLEAAANDVLAMGIQLVVLGTGEKKFHDLLANLCTSHKKQASATLKFNEEFAHQIEAGADMFLMPSRYEPCGLNQMYSMHYGTVPVVRATGGLADSVVDANEKTLKQGKATGFHIPEHTPASLIETLKRAVEMYRSNREQWDSIVKAGMAKDFSWKSSAKAYDALFKRMMKG